MIKKNKITHQCRKCRLIAQIMSILNYFAPITQGLGNKSWKCAL